MGNNKKQIDDNELEEVNGGMKIILIDLLDKLKDYIQKEITKIKK